MPVFTRSFKTLLSFFLLFTGILKAQNLNPTVSPRVNGKMIIKLKPAFKPLCKADRIEEKELAKVMQALHVSTVKQLFPRSYMPDYIQNKGEKKYVDLSTLYEIDFPRNISLDKAIRLVQSTQKLEYAEAIHIFKPLYNPNDPATGSQYYLTSIKAFQAWDITKGDTNVVIGITDTGFDLDHPDLKANIKHNYNDLVDGQEGSDNDGYVDNFSGWDIGENDNDPSPNTSISDNSPKYTYHGVRVAGCAAAVTDNSTGIAGTAFKCKFLPIKITDVNGDITDANGYAGIVYAADHGCKVINCSWGGPNSPTQFGSDVIRYATYNRDALVIAAAGNENTDNPYYPASYEEVISVGGTDINDEKYTKSSYGHHLDLVAPGYNLLSTTYNDTYKYDEGTSFSSPIVAGAAALVRSYFPTATALEAGERLRVNTDFIDSIQANQPYAGMLGSGRLNIYQALVVNKPSVRLTSYILSDRNDSVFTVGDTLRFTGTYKNFLSPTSSGITLSLSSTSSYVTILNSQVTIPSLNTGASENQQPNPFLLVLKPGLPRNEKLLFKITYNSGSYKDVQWIEFPVNVDFMTFAPNAISTTLTSEGRIATTNTGNGIGFNYKGNTFLLEGGLMVGVDTTHVSDCVINVVFNRDTDFVNMATVKPRIPALKGDEEMVSRFSDRGAGANRLPVEVFQHTYGYKSAPDDKYIIIEYTLFNKGNATLSNMYAGLFADWEIMNSLADKTDADSIARLGYAFSTNPASPYAGIKVIKPSTFHCYGFDIVDGGNGGIDIYNGFYKADKYRSLSTNRFQIQNPAGSDISQTVSCGPLSLAAGDSIKIAFAMVVGDSLTDLKKNAKRAQQLYDSVPPVITVVNKHPEPKPLLYPNPGSGIFTLISPSAEAMLEIYSTSGIKVFEKALSSRTNTVDLSHCPVGIYIYSIKDGKGNTKGLLSIFR